jgi:hypothetical protein
VLFAFAGLTTVAGLMAACGTAATTGAAKTTPAHAKVTLSVTLLNGSGAGPKHWTLHCQPAGGTAPDPASACHALLNAKQPFAPVRKTMMCPMILASSQQIELSGTWFGQKVHRVVVDGECDLGFFNSLHKTFY